jgi:hypothetical protein
MTADKPSDMRWRPRRGLIIILVAAGQVVTVVGRQRMLLSDAGARCNRLFLLFVVKVMGLEAVHSSRRFIAGQRRDVVTALGSFARRARSYLIVSIDRTVTGAPGVGPAATIAARLMAPTPADPDAELSPR